MNKALDKAKKEEWSNDVDDEDPGIIFVLWPSDMGATAVHQCLSLPAVAHLDPPLQQGRRIANEGVSSRNLCYFYQVQQMNNP